MLSDICLQQGYNESNNALGNTSNVGLLSTAEVTSSAGLKYSGEIGNIQMRKPVLSSYAQTPVTFKIQLKTEKGDLVNLADFTKITFVLKEDAESRSLFLEKETQVLQSAEGFLKIELAKEDVPYAGIWEAAIILYKGDSIYTEYSMFLELKKGLKYLERNAPIEIAELRMFLLDRCPEDNELIDDYEFSDSEIINALRWAVDKWNESRPVIISASFTPATFPYRYHHMIGATAILLRTKGHNLQRNSMSFSTGNGKVNDKERSSFYLQSAKELSAEYDQWMRGEKHRINVGRCYSTQGSPYFGSRNRGQSI